MPTPVALSVPARRARLAPVSLIAALLGALLTALGGSVIMAGPAAAHDAIISSDPADGTELTTSPAQITLTFNNDLSTLGGQIVVTDAAGATVASDSPTIAGPTAVLAFTEPLANGTYSVTWRAVSSDSHPIEGTFAFTVADPAADVTPEPTVDPTAEETEAAAETPTPIMATDDAGDADDAASEDASPGLPWTGIFIGAALGLAVGIVLMVLGKRRGRKD